MSTLLPSPISKNECNHQGSTFQVITCYLVDVTQQLCYLVESDPATLLFLWIWFWMIIPGHVSETKINDATENWKCKFSCLSGMQSVTITLCSIVHRSEQREGCPGVGTWVPMSKDYFSLRSLLGQIRVCLWAVPLCSPSSKRGIISFIVCGSGLEMEELAACPGVALGGPGPADTHHLGFQGAKLSPLTHGWCTLAKCGKARARGQIQGRK